MLRPYVTAPVDHPAPRAARTTDHGDTLHAHPTSVVLYAQYYHFSEVRMELYLLRHGIAEDRAEDGTDVSRRLTSEGIARMREIARGLRRLDVRPDALLSSPLVRARETAEIVARELRQSVNVSDVLAPGCGVGQLLRLLEAHPRATSIMVVGHEPDFGYLVGALTGGQPVPLKKGGLARVDMTVTEAGFGTLAWLLPPRILRTVGER